MQFTEGLVVIHPHHGPSTVTQITTRTVKGLPVDYAQLVVQQSGMTIMVPIARAAEVGIRHVADEAALDGLADILTTATGAEERSWARRFKAYREEINSGDPRRIAAVVRNLLRRLEHGHLSQGEKELLREASAPLVAEVVLAVDCTDDQARDVIKRLVLEECRDVLDEVGVAS